MGHPHCQWVHDRLPLLAGDELPIADRRSVERHLIGCSACRQRRVALERALDVLHSAAAVAPSQADAPSLWPELARQIRQSRRPAATSLSIWSRLGSGLGFWPSLGVGVSLCVAVLVAAGTRQQVANAQARIAEAARPIAPTVAIAAEPEISEPDDSGSDAARSSTEAVIAETTPATRLGYDLDHGTPMGPDLREGKQPTY